MAEIRTGGEESPHGSVVPVGAPATFTPWLSFQAMNFPSCDHEALLASPTVGRKQSSEAPTVTGAVTELSDSAPILSSPGKSNSTAASVPVAATSVRRSVGEPATPEVSTTPLQVLVYGPAPSGTVATTVLPCAAMTRLPNADGCV